MVKIFRTVPGRDAKAGYAAGVLIAIVALVVVPVHWLLTGTTNNLFITYIWFAVRAVQSIWLTISLRKNGTKWRVVLQEIAATSLYAWRPV